MTFFPILKDLITLQKCLKLVMEGPYSARAAKRGQGICRLQGQSNFTTFFYDFLSISGNSLTFYEHKFYHSNFMTFLKDFLMTYLWCPAEMFKLKNRQQSPNLIANSWCQRQGPSSKLRMVPSRWGQGFQH